MLLTCYLCLCSAWCKKVAGQQLTEQEQKILKHNERYSIMNLTNPLHAYFKPGNRNLFEAVPYDMLHTLHKGLLQNVFMWALSIVYLISSKSARGGNSRHFANNLLLLDQRIRRFPIRQSILPCASYKFHAVSCFIPDGKSSKSYLSKQYMNATKLEAQKYLSMLFQLTICIGTAISYLYAIYMLFI